MKQSFTLVLLLAIGLIQSASAQLTNGIDACQAGKVRYFGKLFSKAQARNATVADYQAGLAYPGDATIDVTYYGLDLRLTHTPAYLNGAATISLKAATNNLSRFYLDLKSQLRVDSVRSAGRSLPFVRDTNRVQISLPQPLSLGQALTLTFYYQGNPASQNTNSSFSFSRHERTADPVIWSLSEPYGASDWFPCKDTPADKVDSSAVSITAAKQFVSVSNGVLAGITDNPDSTRTYRWRNSYPIAQYLISVAMSNYVQYDTPFTNQGQTLPINHFIYPEVLPSVRTNLDRTPDMLRVFTDLFGPYPFLREKYGHAQFTQGNGGMEHQTVSSMEERAFTTNVIAHELAHQWFGDKITCRDWQNIWLNEGFASYAEALYAGASSGQSAYTSTMNAFMSSARNARGSVYVQNISNVGNIFNGNRTYSKGATILHMLRGVLGDASFFRALKTYATSSTLAYGTAVTEDFQTIVEQTSGQQLGYFFKEWIYGENYPTYAVTWQSSPTTTGTGWGVQVRIQQTTNTNPASFTMPIQMRVQSAAGDTLVTVFNDRADQTFNLPAKGQPTGVVLDPNNLILKTVTSTTAVTITGIEEPTAGSLIVFPNPASDNLTLQFTSAEAGLANIQLVDMRGGSTLTFTRIPVRNGNQTLVIPLVGTTPGRYVLRLELPNRQQSAPVLVR